MSDYYNPIVRTFGRYRTALMECAGISRELIRPATPLADLVPPLRRREVWRQLEARGLRMPRLEMPSGARSAFVTLFFSSVGLSVWLAGKFALLGAIPLGIRLFWASRLLATRLIPLRFTVGELVLLGTDVREFRALGRPWTHEEISLRVRALVSEAAGVPIERVQPQSRWADLFG